MILGISQKLVQAVKEVKAVPIFRTGQQCTSTLVVFRNIETVWTKITNKQW